MGLWAPNSIPASAPGPVSAPAFPTPARPPLGQAAVPGLVPVWPSVHGIPVTSLALTPVWLDVSLRPFWPQQPGRVPTQNQPSRCQRSRVPSPPPPHCFPPPPAFSGQTSELIFENESSRDNRMSFFLWQWESRLFE